MYQKLRDFIQENRTVIIADVIDRLRRRTAGTSREVDWEHGVPVFLHQLTRALTQAGRPAGATANSQETIADFSEKKAASALDPTGEITASATLHGQALLKRRFNIAQVVHGYGDVCQSVTQLATDRHIDITPKDFQIFNRCLDDAIAGAVTAYSSQRQQDLDYAGTERLGVLAHELRNLLNTAVLSFDVMKTGSVAINGSTGALLSRSLASMRSLVDRAVSEVRLDSSAVQFAPLSVAELIEEVQVGATMMADGYGVHLTVGDVNQDLAVRVDRQLIASALTNLLQNACKFTRAHGRVLLATSATDEHVLIAISDECGGLPPGLSDRLFQPFTQAGTDRTGIGLGLSIAKSAVNANSGELFARDVPGQGCVFTISLPRLADAMSGRAPH